MKTLKSILEWWRLIGATIVTLPFIKWSFGINEWLKALPEQWLTALVGILSVGFFISIVYLLKVKSENSKKLTLKYGIYWDKNKNPYCPVCEKPVAYDQWQYETWGYYCKPCKFTYELRDALGNKLQPEKALLEL